MCGINQRANGRMEGNTDQAADRQHRPDRRLIQCACVSKKTPT